MSTVRNKVIVAIAATPVIAAAFVAAIVVAFAIPNAPIERHLIDRPDTLLDRRADNGRVIDADTECIGMSVGFRLSEQPASPLHRAVLAQSLYGCDPLMRYFRGSTNEKVRDYFRYWHGYLVVARPALMAIPYNDLRGFLFTLSALLFLALLWRIGEDFGAKTALALAAPFVVINAIGYWVVVTKAVTWLLAIGAGLALSRRKADDPPLLLFFCLGALTAFLDFFTAPAFIFFFSSFIWALYEKRAAREPALTALALFGAFWGAGWAGFIMIKVAIAAALLDAAVWRDFIDAALFRLRGETDYVDSYLPGTAIYANFAAMKSFWGPIAVIAFVILPFATRERRTRGAALFRERSALLVIAVGPLFWLEIFSNHTQIHAAFTQINFAPAFMLGALVIAASPTLAQRA